MMLQLDAKAQTEIRTEINQTGWRMSMSRNIATSTLGCGKDRCFSQSNRCFPLRTSPSGVSQLEDKRENVLLLIVYQATLPKLGNVAGFFAILNQTWPM